MQAIGAYYHGETLEDKSNKIAADNYEKAIKLNPMNPDYYQNLGTALENLGDNKKAIAVYKTGCGLGKKDLCK
jgi:tetratricopeptide (TPR) repeat protein